MGERWQLRTHQRRGFIHSLYGGIHGAIATKRHLSAGRATTRFTRRWIASKPSCKPKHVTLFALIDHSGEAEKVGIAMRPAKLLIFGDPKAGTPLMLDAPNIAIDLPLKILVWEDAEGKVWISYNAADYLQLRHGLRQELVQVLAAAEAIAAQVAG